MKARAKKSWRNGIEPGTPEWDALHNTPQDCERMRAALISIEVALVEGADAADIKAIVQNGLFGNPDPYVAKPSTSIEGERK